MSTTLLTDQRHRVDLIAALVARDVTLRYRRSALGLLWSQLGPLVMLGVLTFLFTRVVPLSIPDYGAFVLTGLLAWTWFSGAIVSATASVAGSADLVRRPRFPVSLLPVVAVGSHLIQFVLALPVLALAVVASTGRLPGTVAALPLVMAVQAVVMIGPAWVLAALNVRFRDVSHLVGVVLFPLFYVTPVFYDAGAVPGSVRWVYRSNPLVHLFEAYRDAALLGRWPSMAPLAVVAGAGLVAAVLGHRAFTAMAPTFPDEV
jgi:lipopolysaccharide transport system permease protein